MPKSKKYIHENIIKRWMDHRHVAKAPNPPANHVNDTTVMAAMPKVNLRPMRWMSERAPLQVAHLNSKRKSLLVSGRDADCTS